MLFDATMGNVIYVRADVANKMADAMTQGINHCSPSLVFLNNTFTVDFVYLQQQINSFL